MVIDPRAHGAVGDGSTKDTSALQSALDACHAAGGGEVRLRHGVFLTGTLYLRSHVDLHLESSATLLASPDIADYATDTHHNRYRNETELDRCLLYAEDADHVTISGAGTIDGNAGAFPNAGDPGQHRPMMLRVLRCGYVRVLGLRMHEAASWTTAFLDSHHVWVEGLDIDNETNHNGDGLDFDGCEHVWVTRCRLRGTDDNLCLQASSREHPTRYVHVSDCELTSVCAGVRIGLKSIGDITDVTLTGLTLHDVHREGIKIECTEGGAIRRIAVTGTVMHNVRRPLWVLLNNRFEPDDLGSSVELDHVPAIGELTDVIVSSLIATDDDSMSEPHLRLGEDEMGSPHFNGIRVDAHPDHRISRLTLRDVHYTAVGGVQDDEIPDPYPPVLDRRQQPTAASSANYWPDWSRAAFVDIRGVDGLVLDSLVLTALRPDERPPVLVEQSEVLDRRVHVR